MTKKPKPVLPQTGYAAISPCSRRPWLHSVRYHRYHVVRFLNETHGKDYTVRQWRAEGYRFVRVSVQP